MPKGTFVFLFQWILRHLHNKTLQHISFIEKPANLTSNTFSEHILHSSQSLVASLLLLRGVSMVYFNLNCLYSCLQLTKITIKTQFQLNFWNMSSWGTNALVKHASPPVVLLLTEWMLFVFNDFSLSVCDGVGFLLFGAGEFKQCHVLSALLHSLCLFLLLDGKMAFESNICFTLP